MKAKPQSPRHAFPGGPKTKFENLPAFPPVDGGFPPPSNSSVARFFSLVTRLTAETVRVQGGAENSNLKIGHNFPLVSGGISPLLTLRCLLTPALIVPASYLLVPPYRTVLTTLTAEGDDSGLRGGAPLTQGSSSRRHGPPSWTPPGSSRLPEGPRRVRRAYPRTWSGPLAPPPRAPSGFCTGASPGQSSFLDHQWVAPALAGTGGAPRRGGGSETARILPTKWSHMT